MSLESENGAGALPEVEPPSEKTREPREGIALCLSGGGYRAMLFHVGALWRLNQLGYLRKLSRVSSVSGGSIIAGMLGLRWKQLQFDANGVATNLDALVFQPIRELASTTIDRAAILKGTFLPGSVGERVAAAYDKLLFKGATLQDLPDDSQGPRFVINASNVQSGALWRFSRPFAWDWKVGKIPSPAFALATAVAASSAFPPFLSPLVLDLKKARFEPGTGDSLQRAPYTQEAVLTDGGVYDNLGLETAKDFKTLLVSDGGGQLGAQEDPGRNWLSHTYRVLNLIDSQVRSLRRRQLMSWLTGGERQGAFWSIHMDNSAHGVRKVLPCPAAKARAIAETPTRLKALPDELQERIICWGYAISDTLLQKWMRAPEDAAFPYQRGVG
jgi:NTE family protein